MHAPPLSTALRARSWCGEGLVATLRIPGCRTRASTALLRGGRLKARTLLDPPSFTRAIASPSPPADRCPSSRAVVLRDAGSIRQGESPTGWGSPHLDAGQPRSADLPMPVVTLRHTPDLPDAQLAAHVDLCGAVAQPTRSNDSTPGRSGNQPEIVVAPLPVGL